MGDARETFDAALERVTARADLVRAQFEALLADLRRSGEGRELAPLAVPDPCPSCRAPADVAQLARSGVCLACGFHLRIPARHRVAQLVDPGSFVLLDVDVAGGDPLTYADPVPYPERLARAQEQTGLCEAVLSGRARIESRPVHLAVFDFGFLGGTMGLAVGERLVRLFERALGRREPVIVVASSGGARLQEGTVALSQMARVAAAVERHHAAGLLYISVLADPVTGGVMVSPGSMGDIVLAEPGAYAAFSGRRVSGETAEMGAEWLQARGMLDGVVSRTELRAVLATLLDLLTVRNRPVRRVARSTSGEDLEAADGWTTAVRVRDAARPSARALVEQMTDVFVELHGDRLYGDDSTILGGIGTLGGQRVAVLAQDRAPRSGPPHPAPEGFRKVLRVALLAAKFQLPVIALIDTAGPQNNAEAEGRGLAFAIGRCLRVFSVLPVPVIAAITGEGGSGAAVALAAADRLLMLQHATYEVIAPEAAAAILHRDCSRAADLAQRMGITAPEALRLGVIDGIVAEPPDGAAADPAGTALLLRGALIDALAESQRWLPDRLVERRYRRLRSIGAPYLRRSTEPRAAGQERGQAAPGHDVPLLQ